MIGITCRNVNFKPGLINVQISAKLYDHILAEVRISYQFNGWVGSENEVAFIRPAYFELRKKDDIIFRLIDLPRTNMHKAAMAIRIRICIFYFNKNN